MSGYVSLVGAGPGDPGLLTRKGADALAQAQVVIYDRLVNPEILQLAPSDAELISVGKQAGNHPVPQEEISQMLLRQAQSGKRVVRLKGGDPFLFGRGGEELELLASHGIAFQVIPGVSSALAVPAYSGIPVTHRQVSSSVHILTGHARDNAPLELDFKSLVQVGGTLVFLMAAAALSRICQGLLDAGMKPETPAAAVERGTLPQQRTILATVSTLAQKASEVRSPAMILVGPVCSYADALSWFAPSPRKTVVVTRPADRRGTLSRALTELGMEVVDFPCIRTVPCSPCPELDGALMHLEAYDWLVFTSPFGVKVFFDRLLARNRDSRALAKLKLAAIGPKTADALLPYGLRADLIPAVYDSEHLAQAMAEVDGPVLLCRASQSSRALPQLFAGRGIPCLDAAVYDTVYAAENPAPVLSRLDAPLLVTFTSASTVRGFVGSLPGADLRHILGCCIGPKTEAEAKKYGITTVTAQEATIGSLINCIKEVQL